jgi:hypothetical protein
MFWQSVHTGYLLNSFFLQTFLAHISVSGVTSSLTNYTIIAPVAEDGKFKWNILLVQKVKQ